MSSADLVIVGAGAAGLMAAIWAGRTARRLHLSRRIVVLDGANKLGAKILVAGGGRCNVTHDHVSEQAYAGSSRNAIKKVLRRFDVTPTVAFFNELGVKLKREETGKLFPVTDDAHTVLDALLRAAADAQVTFKHPARVEAISRGETGFHVRGAWGELTAPRLILATGGKSLPKSGSDGVGYELAKSLGHTLTPHIFPALVPLRLPSDHFLCALSGLTVNAVLMLYAGAGKELVSFTDSTLCTHFGLSGPSVLDFSRYYTAARFDDPAAHAAINWLPDTTTERLEADLLQAGKRSILRWLDGRLPERLLRALCAEAGVEAGMPLQELTRDQRKQLTRVLTRLPLPITGDRGYNYAEVTAGGIPLTDIRLETMESRLCPGLHYCGEICDVDGRIGGYNFQWAWASGYVAGQAAIDSA
ncbi:MAG: aminoacetone oxidase family FAD-binding enzyme [Anaerolineae bacterium]|nr:aminoacetone oxidase family FAD-binding enzyme [Anaerolineae bacterium]